MSKLRRGPVFLFIIIAINLFLMSSYAQQSVSSLPCLLTGTSTDPGTCIASAIPLCAIGIGISLFLVGIFYVAGEILNYRQLKSFYKDQLWETIKSAIIIVIIFSALTVASGIAVSFAGPANSQTTSTSGSALTNNLANLYTTTDTNYLQPQLQAAEASFGDLISLSVGSDILSSLQLELWFPIPLPGGEGIIGSINFGVDTGLLESTFITPLYAPTIFSFSLSNVAADGVLTMIMILQVQHDLLYSIAALALGVLIPIGIIMRAIPFMRGIGGTLIAMGIGIAIVYPALLIGFNLPVTNYMFSLTSPQASQLNCDSIGLLCTLWNAAAYLTNSVVGFVTGTIPLTLAFGTQTGSTSYIAGSGYYIGLYGPFQNVLNPAVGASTIEGGIFPALNFVIDNTLGQFLQLLLFIIDLVMGYAVSQGIARLLGGNIELGIGRFKLA